MLLLHCLFPITMSLFSTDLFDKGSTSGYESGKHFIVFKWLLNVIAYGPHWIFCSIETDMLNEINIM